MSVRTRQSMRRWMAAVVFVLACMGAGVASARAAQPAQPAARDEFVPIREIPQEDQLPAAPLLIGAYGVAWLVILLYVWTLWRRQGRVETELHALRARLSSRGR